jgi:hypothetical protein
MQNLPFHPIINHFIEKICGVVRRGNQIPLGLKIESTWEFFNIHRQQLINILSWEEVCKK